MRRITAWVKETLAELKRRDTDELERGFIVHRTLADPRFLDPALDPNGRKAGWFGAVFNLAILVITMVDR